MPTPPPPKNPWTDADTEQLLDLHRKGMSLHAIAQEMKRGKATISRRAREAGLDFDRAQTAKAAEAVSVDNKARRVKIVSRMYDRMEHLQDRLEAPTFKAILKGSFGVEETRTLAFVPDMAERNIADTLSRYAVTAAKLEAIDATSGAEVIVGLLQQTAAALGIHDESDTQP